MADVPILPPRRGVSPTQHIVAMLVISGYFGLALILALRSVPTENKEPLLMVVGALGAAFGAVVGFYFTMPSASARASDAPKPIDSPLEQKT